MSKFESVDLNFLLHLKMCVKRLKMHKQHKDEMRNVLNMKMLLNGNILDFCKSEVQRVKALTVICSQSG